MWIRTMILIFFWLALLCPPLLAQDSTYAYQCIHEGDSLRKLMQLEQAAQRYTKAEEVLISLEDWAGLLLARNHRARILIQNQQYSKADSLIQESLALGKKHFPAGHSSIADSYNLLAAVEGLSKAHYLKALHLHQQALSIVQDLPDEAAQVTKARSLGSIGMVYELLGNYDQALHYIGLEIDLFKQLRGPESMFLAFSYQDLGKISALKGANKEAIAYYEQSVALLKKKTGSRP